MIAECNWPFWVCLDGASRRVLITHQWRYHDPLWQPPAINWGGCRYNRQPVSKPENVPAIMQAKPRYSNSGWRG